MSSMGMDETIDLNFGGVEGIQGGFQPIPPGVYRLRIDEPHLKATKDGTGRGIVFTPMVIEGEQTGRKLKDEFWNIPTAELEAKDFEKYKKANGFLRGKLESVYGSLPEDLKLNVKDMAGREFMAVVILKDDGKGYGAQNDIATYLPVGTNPASVAVPQNVVQAAPSNGGAQTAAVAAPALGRFRI